MEELFTWIMRKQAGMGQDNNEVCCVVLDSHSLQVVAEDKDKSAVAVNNAVKAAVTEAGCDVIKKEAEGEARKAVVESGYGSEDEKKEAAVEDAGKAVNGTGEAGKGGEDTMLKEIETELRASRENLLAKEGEGEDGGKRDGKGEEDMAKKEDKEDEKDGEENNEISSSPKDESSPKQVQKVPRL